MSKLFNQKAFEKAFEASLAAVAASEKVGKAELQTLSRTVLEAWHSTGQIVYANKLLAVVSPMNRKTLVLYFTHFSGYSYSKEAGQFTEKSKKRYAKALELCNEFLADPLNNVWSWAERHVTVEHDASFKIKAFTTYINGAVKKAQGAGIGQDVLLKIVLSAGITADTILAVMSDETFCASIGVEHAITAE